MRVKVLPSESEGSAISSDIQRTSDETTEIYLTKGSKSNRDLAARRFGK